MSIDLVSAAKSRDELAQLWERLHPQGLWTDELTAAAKARLVALEVPRCRMCARPARWLTVREQWAPYCSGQSCNNRERLCQQCGASFIMGSGGAGTKYCSTACKTLAYHPQREWLPERCAWCDKPGAARKGYRKHSIWPYICGECLEPIRHVIDRLKDHRVSHDMARRLLDDPGCAVCGRNTLEKIKDLNGTKLRASLVVDHDHTCCPVTSKSCGKCIRGFLCRYCNAAIGLLGDSPKHARSVAEYLESWFSR